MIDLKNTEGIYFIGIGGIGMSALALYFLHGGFTVSGYDRTETELTRNLSGEGCDIIYSDDDALLKGIFSDAERKNKVTVVYTPAIPSDSKILAYFHENGYAVYKRSEILGAISAATDTLAIAGTHGKTTVSTMTAHLLKQSHVDCSAFLGGISKNYNTNLLLGRGSFTVMEADEFDRSFHRLSPLIAVVTSLDPDHLDIYGNRDNMVAAYNEFCARIRKGGKLILSSRIRDEIIVPDGVVCYTYGTGPDADYHVTGISRDSDMYRFSLDTPSGVINDIHFSFPGKINIENLSAAIAVAQLCGVTNDEIKKAVLLFRGVKRRFDIRINRDDIVYIDDYAHHPDEINACIESVKEYFSGRKITGIFQPHLFSRTADHAKGFAHILDRLDEVILLPVYPAREKPVAGVTSALIYNNMKLENKRMLNKEDIPAALDIASLDILLTIGAGDIDTLVRPIEEKIRKEKGL
ncbi:MAG TPA: UDP-N-acetylmuramate--L-alanine ligase [Bacteroidales bacterium]|nr:UDP-N-acetylmuramate--L-alanine ligase [Bacteroidales bacterium]